jgi:UDP-N-acetylbacillosamine N-acetyltransferase
VVYGGGDHGLVVAEAAEAAGFMISGFLDDNLASGQVIGWWEVLNPNDQPTDRVGVIIGIGDNTTRQQLASQLKETGLELVSVIHPTAWVSLSATVGEGVFVGPQAVVHNEASVAKGAIVNSGAIVEHHNQLGAFAHVAPGAVLGGRCEVGPGSLIGVGARVLPRRTIGEGATVGAGAVVDRDVPAYQTVAGVPAREH